MTAPDASSLTPQQLARAVEIARELDRRDRQNLFSHYFPDETHEWRGETFYARHLYPRHLAFFAAGATYRERLFRAANRVGKTKAGGYEIAAHLTGRYPHWWEGRRYKKPIHAWAAGKTYKSTRDAIQNKTLLGPATGSNPKGVAGTGMIPGDAIGRVTWGQGVADLVDTVQIKHVSGGWSALSFKAYEQGRGAFEAEALDYIWFDEEPPFDVYGEALIRTATTNGVVAITFTPLEGMSDVVLSFEGDDVARDMSYAS